MSRIIIDVRQPIEYKMGHAKGAINLPPAKLMAGLPKELASTPKETEIILYWMSGARSGAAMQIIKNYGFTNLVNGINKDHVKAKYL